MEKAWQKESFGGKLHTLTYYYVLWFYAYYSAFHFCIIRANLLNNRPDIWLCMKFVTTTEIFRKKAESCQKGAG